METSSISQTIIPGRNASLPVSRFLAQDLVSAAQTIQSLGVAKLGLATQLSEEGLVEALAFATCDRVIYLNHPVSTAQKANSVNSSLAPILASEEYTLAGFSMARQAVHISRDLYYHVCAVDLSTVLPSSTREPWSPAKCVKDNVSVDANRFDILELWYPTQDSKVKIERTCLQAWLAALCSGFYDSEPTKVDTLNLSTQELACIGKLLQSIELLEKAKPLHAENEFSVIESVDGGNVDLQNSRFKTRLRASSDTKIVLETAAGHSIVGQATHAEGRKTRIQIVQGTYRGDIERVRVEGREGSTCSEHARDEFILRLLQGEISIQGRQFITFLWFPPPDYTRQTRPKHVAPSSDAFQTLNDSQREVSAAMISENEPLVVAHGPPGTGKTTTISAAVEWWHENKQPVYIVAQSNVGVKNIARSLAKKRFNDFKLLVSKEFYYEWHEPLYEKVVHNIIRSDDLSGNGDPGATERLLGGTRVILCTLSMLSNPALHNCGVFKLVPVERLVIDEASQIDESQYMHLFHKFLRLQKVCAFGDPKQLPPYGRDVASELKSIFEIKHLKSRAYFLNTQYRMPVPLGSFISDYVYDKKLKSVHKIKDMSCVAFVNVSEGTEEAVGKSWKNTAEANMIVTLVKEYYGRLDFCIITPYDAQRAAIVRALEARSLPSDRVYNVDSFQGHEAQYVLLSTVRTTRPGFLTAQERTNVMLTRCEAGMVIVSNRSFVCGTAKWTLLGDLAARWAEHAKGNVWVDWRDVAARTVALPGVRAPSAGLVLPAITPSPLRTFLSTDTSTSTRRPQSAGGSSKNGKDADLGTARELITGLEGLQLMRTQSAGSPRGGWGARQKEAHDATVKQNQEFPSLGDGSELPKNTLKGQWKRGSAAVKSRWRAA